MQVCASAYVMLYSTRHLHITITMPNSHALSITLYSITFETRGMSKHSLISRMRQMYVSGRLTVQDVSNVCVRAFWMFSLFFLQNA